MPSAASRQSQPDVCIHHQCHETAGPRLCCIDLGITLSRNLTFHEHVNRILADCYRKLFIIKKCFLVINEDILRKLYVSYLRPSLEYGSVIWAPHSDSEIKLLDAFQHRVLTLHGHNIVLESLETRRMRMDLTWYYKILHNLTCLNQANFFIPNIRQGLRSHELSIVVPRTTTSAFKFAFAQRRIAQWNALPSHVAGARTLSHFKELISSYVIQFTINFTVIFCYMDIDMYLFFGLHSMGYF